MLPSNLLITRRWRNKIRPVYAKLNQENLRVAKMLIQTYMEYLGRRKGEINEIVNEFEEFGYDYRYVRGLATLLDRRCKLEPKTTLDPVKVRRQVFEIAHKKGFPTTPAARRAVLHQAAGMLEVTVKELEESLYGDLFSHYVKTLAETREKSEEEIKALVDHGFFQGDRALEAGLVDDLLYEDEFEDLLKEKEKKLSKITHGQYLKIEPSSLGLNRGKKIALIYGTGAIHTGEGFYQAIGSSTMARMIKRARKDKSVTAIVLRVDSPGGSAVASDVIWREVALAKKEKPFVVSMSDVAGSGGYWISMTAHKIVAQPQTLTGSIGVISGKFNLVKLYEKLGITSEKLTFGKRADLFSTFRKLTREERNFLKNEILWIYDKFLVKVAEGRNLSKEDVDRIGRGRVWTGSQAKEQGLVDEMGGLSRALELAKELAGIPVDEEVRLVVRPRKVSFLDAFFGRRMIKMNLGLNPGLEKMLSTYMMLDKERILAIMPFWFAPE